jgi:hypothetical protein
MKEFFLAMANRNEIKKALYRQKPLAVIKNKDASSYRYSCVLDGSIIKFNVPVSDMGDSKFEDQMPAHLLIRWISYEKV